MGYYECQHCGHRFNRARKYKPGSGPKCPECGKTAYSYKKPLKPGKKPEFHGMVIGDFVPKDGIEKEVKT